MTRRRVAELSGMSEDHLEGIEVSHIVAGYRDIKALASALGMPEHELLEVAGYVAPKSS